MQILSEIRYAFRTLAKAPSFLALAVLGTGIGVAAVTAVFSLADAALFRSMPYRESGRLVLVWDQLLKLGFTRFPLSIANYHDYRAQNTVFDDIAAFEPRAVTVIAGGRPERVPVTLASANFLPLLGAAVARGRWFEASENYHRGAPVAVVSDAFWHTRLGGKPSALGATIQVDGEPRTVVGILPLGFGFRLAGEPPAVWLPAVLDIGARDAGNLRAIGRLRRGVTAAQAQNAMSILAAELKRRLRVGMGPHGEDGGYGIMIVSLRDELFGAAKPTIYGLLAASLQLLVLSFASTALLWVGRAAARSRDAAVRVALGAPRARLARQFIIESLVPSTAGAALALLLASAALRAANAARLAELSALDGLTIDVRVFCLAVLLSAAAGVIFGILPLRSLHRSWLPGRGAAERSESRTLRLLIALQVAVSCALLPSGFLLARSLAALERVDPGFHAHGLLTAYLSLPSARYATPPLTAAYYQRLEQALPSIGLASALPLSLEAGGDPFSIEGRTYGSSGTAPQFAHAVSVSRRYLALMQIPLIAGRAFADRDFREQSEPVALVNRTLAAAFWPGESPPGKRILMGAPRPGARWMTIIGVTGDVHSSELGRPPIPQVYQPYPQAPRRTMALVFSGTPDLRELSKLDPEVPLYDVAGIDQRIADSIVRPRVQTAVFSAYGGVAFLLAAFGVYSVALYASVRRRREFAVCAALGASPAQLRMAVLRGTLHPAAFGAAIGLAAAAWLAASIRAFLFHAAPSDWTAYAAAAVAVIGTAAFAGWWGGRRLPAIDPAAVLRTE